MKLLDTREQKEQEIYDFFERIDKWTDWDAFYKEHPELKRREKL